MPEQRVEHLSGARREGRGTEDRASIAEWLRGQTDPDAAERQLIEEGDAADLY